MPPSSWLPASPQRGLAGRSRSDLPRCIGSGPGAGIPRVVESAVAGRYLSATNLLALNVAPCGSAMTVIRMVYVGVDQGASNGGTITPPPSSVALAAVASASALAKVTLQCGGVSGWSS